MAPITCFEDVKARQLTRKLAREIYGITNVSEFRYDYGLKDEIRRAAGSTMHNIAEGFDAGSDKEFTRFLIYARRSASEVQSQLYFALDQRYITQTQFDHLTDLANQCKRAINGFIRYLSKP